MSDPSGSNGHSGAWAEHPRFHVPRGGLSALLALFLLSATVPLGLAGGVAGSAAPSAADGTAIGVAPMAGPANEVEDLTTPEAVAGLQTVPGISFYAVSCISKDQCVAVGHAGGGQGGAYVVITDGRPGPVDTVPGTDVLDSVDCVSAHTCYAAGEGPYTNPEGQPTTGGAIVTISDGSLSTVNVLGVPPVGIGDPGYMYLAGIGCSGTSACIATGYTQALGGFSVTVANGLPSYNLVPTGPETTNGVECVSGGRCMINAGVLEDYGRGEAEYGWDWAARIGAKGYLHLGNAGGVLRTTLNGGTCHQNDLEFCLIAGSAGKRAQEGVVDVAVGVASAHDADVPGTSSLGDVSCSGMYWCVATGATTSGEGVLVPIGWDTLRTAIPVSGTTDFSGVSCVSTGLCVAVGGGPGGSGVFDSFKVWN